MLCILVQKSALIAFSFYPYNSLQLVWYGAKLPALPKTTCEWSGTLKQEILTQGKLRKYLGQEKTHYVLCTMYHWNYGIVSISSVPDVLFCEIFECKNTFIHLTYYILSIQYFAWDVDSYSVQFSLMNGQIKYFPDHF